MLPKMDITTIDLEFVPYESYFIIFQAEEGITFTC